MDAPILNPETTRLTDLKPENRHPWRCQFCFKEGRYKSFVLAKRDGHVRLSFPNLRRWRECDHNDKPEHRLLVLCGDCEKRTIKDAPRLYIALDDNDPWPGCMAICVDCRWRQGVSCSHPSAIANGGAGVLITLPKALHGFIDGQNYRGRITVYSGPATGCKQKEEMS